MRTRTLLALAAGLALLPAAPAAAQAIRAGMSEAEVRSRLGEPDVVRGDDAWRYLFYANGCAVRCGSDDVVFLRDGRVVTAVFRTARRRFVGPGASDALEAAGGNLLSPSDSIPMRRAPGAPRRAAPGQEAGRARVEGIRMVVPGSGDVDQGDLLILPGDAGRPGAAGTRIESTLADTAMEQTARDRERNLTPRTVRPGNRDSAVADTALDQTRRDRERQVTPRTVRPRGDAGARPRPRPQAPGTPQP